VVDLSCQDGDCVRVAHTEATRLRECVHVRVATILRPASPCIDNRWSLIGVPASRLRVSLVSSHFKNVRCALEGH
jgi:hypothetical protein